MGLLECHVPATGTLEVTAEDPKALLSLPPSSDTLKE